MWQKVAVQSKALWEGRITCTVAMLPGISLPRKVTWTKIGHVIVIYVSFRFKWVKCFPPAQKVILFIFPSVFICEIKS